MLSKEVVFFKAIHGREDDAFSSRLLYKQSNECDATRGRPSLRRQSFWRRGQAIGKLILLRKRNHQIKKENNQHL